MLNPIQGLVTQFDPNDGTSAGPAFIPNDIDPNNQTRSDARRTYYDPYVSIARSNSIYLCSPACPISPNLSQNTIY